MAYVLSSVSGNLISAASAGYAPTNSGDVSAIASSYQVVSSTATQLYAGTAYVTSVNDAPISAARAGNAANASLANSAYYDGTGRLISALPDSATVSAIASSYAESAASSKLDSSASSSFYPADNPSGFISSVDLSDYATTAYVDSSVSSKLDATASANFYPSDNPSGFISSVDLSDYATTAYVDSSISGFAYDSAVSGWTAKQDALTFGYDTADKISSINGSSLAGEGGGGGLVTAIGTSESGITSLNNSGLVDTAALRSADYSSLYVQEPLYISASGDSSYIGISGTQVNADWAETASAAPSYIENKPDLVDIVAGPGIIVDNPDGNTLRVSTDENYETVLWSGDTGMIIGSSSGSCSLSESAFNFEKIGIYAQGSVVACIELHCFEIGTSPMTFGLVVSQYESNETIFNDACVIGLTGSTLSYSNGSRTELKTTIAHRNDRGPKLVKIVGIHRIANN